MTRVTYLIVWALLAGPFVATAQTPDPKKATPSPAATAAPATPKAPPLPSPPANYQYAAEGRRDPFVSLINRGTDARGQQAVKRADGVAGMLTAELTVRGTMLGPGGWLAMVSGPDKKVYSVRAGDRLADGVIRMITAQSVVISQEVNDPLSLEKQREVRKFLRGGGEVK